MQKLLTVNMEGDRHLPAITEFITNHNPDIICLQETPGQYSYTLMSLGYHVTYRAMLRDHQKKMAPGDTIGIAVASKHAHEAVTFSYFGQQAAVPTHSQEDRLGTTSFGAVACAITGTDGETYHVSTAHPPVTENGRTTEFQTRAITNLLAKNASLPPHILCGDMNIPRGYNQNYDLLRKRYRDDIPDTYTSSLDRNLHQETPDTEIFSIFMVDYIFSQEPYLVRDVQLHFGVSDHAAITATISKKI